MFKHIHFKIKLILPFINSSTFILKINYQALPNVSRTDNSVQYENVETLKNFCTFKNSVFVKTVMARRELFT